MSVSMSKRILYFFIFSFLTGVIIATAFSEASILQNGYFSAYSLERLQYIKIDGTKLFLCIFQNRMKIILLLVIAGTTVFGICMAYLFVMWYGISMGIVTAIFVSRFGWKGGILFLACIMPQILFYIPGFYWLIKEVIIFFPRDNYNRYEKRKEKKMLHIFKIIGSIGVVIIGIVLESYVNPQVVSKIVIFLKFM